MKQLLVKLAKDVIGRLLVLTGVHRRLLRGKAVVVAFHSVTVSLSDGALRCSVRDFDRYCRFFARYLEPITLSALIEALGTRRPFAGEVAITFDDGYADNAELALPVLRRWRLPATFFVTTGFIESETQAPWDCRANVHSRWMTWQQVGELAAAGHEIGAHTVTHPDLGFISLEVMEQELRCSRDAIDERLGPAPRHFAVPFGRSFATLPAVKDTARRLGFTSMSLCRGGIVDDSTSAMQVERWPIDPTEYLSPYGWLFDLVRERRALTGAAAANASAAVS